MQNSSRPEIPRLYRRVALGVLCTLLFTQCETTKKKTYKSAEYTPDKLATPTGHGMKKKEYPFDDAGNYRKDWVKTKSNSRTKSSYKRSPVSTAQANSSASNTPNKTLSPSNYPDYVGNTATPAYSPAPSVAVPEPKPSVRYHKVASGDTLYSLSRKYGVSVTALKNTNGLSSDLIRKGQSLRIP